MGVKNKFLQKDGWEQPPDLHLNVRLKTGWIAEVQMLFRDILQIKKELHKFYSINRAESEFALLKPLYNLPFNKPEMPNVVEGIEAQQLVRQHSEQHHNMPTMPGGAASGLSIEVDVLPQQLAVLSASLMRWLRC